MVLAIFAQPFSFPCPIAVLQQNSSNQDSLYKILTSRNGQRRRRKTYSKSPIHPRCRSPRPHNLLSKILCNQHISNSSTLNIYGSSRMLFDYRYRKLLQACLLLRTFLNSAIAFIQTKLILDTVERPHLPRLKKHPETRFWCRFCGPLAALCAKKVSCLPEPRLLVDLLLVAMLPVRLSYSVHVPWIDLRNTRHKAPTYRQNNPIPKVKVRISMA